MTPLGADPLRHALDARVLAWMREAAAGDDAHWQRDDARFDELGCALFSHQVAHCPPYARFCSARGVDPAAVHHWRDIPAVPAGAFKEMALRSFDPQRECHVFRTSGTSTERRGALHLDTLDVYEASLLPPLRRHLLPQLSAGDRARLRVLAPSAQEAPDSSLSHMFACALAELGDAGSGWDVRDGELRVDALLAALESAACDGLAVTLLGTAFAFVHLLDAFAGRGVRLVLPAGSSVMETGGFKGRSRELSREALWEGLERALGVAASRVVNQYGMTELGSQFYDSVLRDPAGPRRKLGPPWARVRLVDPETGADTAPGQIGVVTVLDLANTGSVCAIQTADLGRVVGNASVPGDSPDDGFEVLGRAEGAEARGCSIAADEMLGP